MSWSEFSTLLAGLNSKTPLGEIVAIRSETNPELLKNFTPYEKEIRREWRSWIAKEDVEKNPEGVKRELRALQEALKNTFGGDG